MTGGNIEETKLLFILSSDYGELFDAMSLVIGSRLNAVFLMPAALFSVNGTALPYRTYRYNSASDIQSFIDREKPDLALLFSGYLYAVNDILDEESLERLLHAWHDRKLKVATSDPFLGIMSAVEDDTFHDRHPQRARLKIHFSRISRLLQDIVHIYHSTLAVRSAKQLSFFNRNIILQRSEILRHRNELLAWPAIDGSKDRWLFVLSPDDYAGRIANHGEDRFLELLSARLQDAAAAGRQPVLVAPRSCVDQIKTRAEGIGDMIAFSSCDFKLFMALLHDAEFVFYWNMFSATIVTRALNRMPFFLFDRGHLARAIKPFLAAAARQFYPDCQIEFLDEKDPLQPARLAILAKAQEAGLFAPAYRNFSKSLSPEELIQEI